MQSALDATRTIRFKSALLALVFLGAGTAAHAVPTTYIIDPSLSSATVDIFLGATAIASGAPISIDGTNIVFDSGTPTGSLLDFTITASGGFALSGGPVSFVDIQSAVMTPAGGFSAGAGSSCTAAGCNSNFSGQVLLSGVVVNLGGPNVALPDAIQTAVIPSLQTNGMLDLSMTGITIGQFPALDMFGQPTGQMVVVKADINLVAVAVPEPGAAFLMGAGLLFVGANISRKRAV